MHWVEYIYLIGAKYVNLSKTELLTPLFFLIQLQTANGGDLLEQHIREHPSNAQYMSKFSVLVMVDAMNNLARKKVAELSRV